MTSGESARPNYVAVWGWLVMLLIVSVVTAYLPLPHTAVLLVIFGAAVAKALLVAANYMHIRFEKWLIYAIAITPVVLFIGLTLVLMPDIVFSR